MPNREKSQGTRSWDDTHGNRHHGGNNSGGMSQGIFTGAGKTTGRR